MKTLNQFRENFSGILTPKSSDEKKFVDKHTVKVVPDRVGNKDDVFKATNVKKYMRMKTRHGYDDSEKTYEQVTAHLSPSDGPATYVESFIDSDALPEEMTRAARIKAGLIAFYDAKNESYTDEDIDSLVEEIELDEEVEVNPARYQNAHGKMPKGHGSWFFTAHRGGINFDKHKNGVDHVLAPAGSFDTAKKYAQKWGQSMGHKLIHVSEEMVGDDYIEPDASKIDMPNLTESLDSKAIDALSKVFEQLDDTNKITFINTCKTQAGIDQLLNFAITTGSIK